VGKTQVAQAIGHAACMQGRSALFDKTARVLSDLVQIPAGRRLDEPVSASASFSPSA